MIDATLNLNVPTALPVLALAILVASHLGAVLLGAWLVHRARDGQSPVPALPQRVAVQDARREPADPPRKLPTVRT